MTATVPPEVQGRTDQPQQLWMRTGQPQQLWMRTGQPQQLWMRTGQPQQLWRRALLRWQRLEQLLCSLARVRAPSLQPRPPAPRLQSRQPKRGLKIHPLRPYPHPPLPQSGQSPRPSDLHHHCLRPPQPLRPPPRFHLGRRQQLVLLRGRRGSPSAASVPAPKWWRRRWRRHYHLQWLEAHQSPPHRR